MNYDDKPRKWHFFKDQKGASYRSMGKERKYADTACKHNWPVENVTANPALVTCKRCLRMMAKAAVVEMPQEMADQMASDSHDLQEWLDAERAMADKMAALARWLLDRLGQEVHAVVVMPDFSVGDFARGQLALFDEHKDSRKGRWNEPPLD